MKEIMWGVTKNDVDEGVSAGMLLGCAEIFK